MYIDIEAIKALAALLTALGVIGGAGFALFRWINRQASQDVAIASLKEENQIICYGLLACLDGLQQLGCNHSVPKAREKLEKHLNTEAHK